VVTNMSHIAHTTELCCKLHMGLSHIAHGTASRCIWDYVMLHMGLRHVTYECVASRIHEACHEWKEGLWSRNDTCCTWDYVVSCMRLSRVTHIRKRCGHHVSRVAHGTRSCHVCVKEELWSPNESCCKWDWFVSRICRIWMSQVTHIEKKELATK